MSDIIDIEIVVDTQNLIQSFQNPSQDPKNPTGWRITLPIWLLQQLCTQRTGNGRSKHLGRCDGYHPVRMVSLSVIRTTRRISTTSRI